jgi:hypothetical protein
VATFLWPFNATGSSVPGAYPHPLGAGCTLVLTFHPGLPLMQSILSPKSVALQNYAWRSPYTRARWIALCPLMYPMTCDTEYFGGIEINIDLASTLLSGFLCTVPIS